MQIGTIKYFVHNGAEAGVLQNLTCRKHVDISGKNLSSAKVAGMEMKKNGQWKEAYWESDLTKK